MVQIHSTASFALNFPCQNQDQKLCFGLQVLHNQAGNYLALRKQLVGLTLHFALRLHLSQETAHTALALMDRCALAGLQAPDNLQPALVCTCLRVAAIQENAYLPTPAQVEALTQIPARQLQVMESQFLAVLQNDTECISAVHCLKVSSVPYQPRIPVAPLL